MKLFLVCIQFAFFVKAFSSYPIATGERDLERLQILNELYNPSTLYLLELKPNIRVLTIGCGIGLLARYPRPVRSEFARVHWIKNAKSI